jgi:hypothetical protein
MKEKQMPFVLLGGAILLMFVVVAIAAMVVAYFAVRSYAPGVLSPFLITTPTPSTTHVITSTLSYGDALGTYEKIAAKAIEASDTALETMKWVLGSVLAIAVGVVTYLYKISQEAAQRSKLAESKAQDAQNDAADVRNQINDLSKRFDRLSERYMTLHESYANLKGETVSLSAALQAWDKGDISQDELIEAQQLHSWRKWIQRKDETGFRELLEDVRSGDGLVASMRSLVEEELAKVRERTERERPSSGDELYEQRLQLLLPDSTE